MTRLRRRDGAALVGVLAVTAVLLPLVAHLHAGIRIEMLLARSAAARLQAPYSAEAGLALALEALRHGIATEALFAGPDGVAASADDGTFPFPVGSPTGFPDARFALEVTIGPAGANRVEIGVVARGPLETGRALRALVELPAAAGSPPRLLGWRDVP